MIAANPTFAGNTRLPADGDLIVRSKDESGYLIDFKSAKRIEPMGTLVVLRQVLTHALMMKGASTRYAGSASTSLDTGCGLTGAWPNCLIWAGAHGARSTRRPWTRISRRFAGIRPRLAAAPGARCGTAAPLSLLCLLSLLYLLSHVNPGEPRFVDCPAYRPPAHHGTFTSAPSAKPVLSVSVVVGLGLGPEERATEGWTSGKPTRSRRKL